MLLDPNQKPTISPFPLYTSPGDFRGLLRVVEVGLVEAWALSTGRNSTVQVPTRGFCGAFVEKRPAS